MCQIEQRHGNSAIGLATRRSTTCHGCKCVSTVLAKGEDLVEEDVPVLRPRHSGLHCLQEALPGGGSPSALAIQAGRNLVLVHPLAAKQRPQGAAQRRLPAALQAPHHDNNKAGVLCFRVRRELQGLGAPIRGRQSGRWPASAQEVFHSGAHLQAAVRNRLLQGPPLPGLTEREHPSTRRQPGGQCGMHQRETLEPRRAKLLSELGWQGLLPSVTLPCTEGVESSFQAYPVAAEEVSQQLRRQEEDGPAVEAKEVLDNGCLVRMVHVQQADAGPDPRLRSHCAELFPQRTHSDIPSILPLVD
mmetsp:Transcript_78822/g.218000  ORF Transcript_78822/g.218000 Transcript_78822/m.218000 type:complete len:302 (-) Transcript_78822:169-1074(-)